MPVVDALVAAAETVLPGPGPLRGAPAEEVGLVYRWMTEPGARIVSTSEPVALPDDTFVVLSSGDADSLTVERDVTVWFTRA